jgi:hypothetical protein
MREIPLSRGQVAIVDDEDYEWISKYKWFAHWDVAMGSYYACRNQYVLGSGRDRPKYIRFSMHREILGLKRGDRRKGDHREPSNTLDNRRSNLRISTHGQNICNARLRDDNSSGFKGVHRLPTGRYQARIMSGGKRISLGVRSTPEAAHELWKAAAKIYYGEFARTS